MPEFLSLLLGGGVLKEQNEERGSDGISVPFWLPFDREFQLLP